MSENLDRVDRLIVDELISDGRATLATLAERNVGAFRGRWQLESQRATNGGRLLIDAGNPFVSRPRRCTLIVAGKSRTINLAWRPLPAVDFDERLGATSQRAHPDFAAKVLADGTRWY
ncbi:MAG: hypothetical protein EOP29_12465, partial [Rhodococcus sp. (in: high G+C Gram-positive bacteria)]